MIKKCDLFSLQAYYFRYYSGPTSSAIFGSRGSASGLSHSCRFWSTSFQRQCCSRSSPAPSWATGAVWRKEFQYFTVHARYRGAGKIPSLSHRSVFGIIRADCLKSDLWYHCSPQIFQCLHLFGSLECDWCSSGAESSCYGSWLSKVWLPIAWERDSQYCPLQCSRPSGDTDHLGSQMLLRFLDLGCRWERLFWGYLDQTRWSISLATFIHCFHKTRSFP